MAGPSTSHLSKRPFYRFLLEPLNPGFRHEPLQTARRYVLNLAGRGRRSGHPNVSLQSQRLKEGAA